MPSDPHSPVDAERDAQTMAVLGRLQAACASDTNASLMAAHMTLSCAGRLRSATSDGVVVEVPNPPTSETTILGSTAAVSFSIGEQMAGFVSEIIALSAAEDGTLMATLRLPEQLQVGERRSAVRIPVPRGTLRAAFMRDGSPDLVEAVDISLTGILLELPPGLAEAQRVGSTVSLRLTLDRTVVLTDAEVCRRDGNRFGLRYRTEGPPPKGLARVLYALQEARRPTR